MKRCKNIQELFSEYLEGTLPASLHREVRNHLRSCPECRQTLQSLQRIFRLLPALSDSPPPHLARRLNMIPIPTTSVPARANGIYQLKWVAAAFIGFVLLFNLFYFTNFNPRMNRFLHHLVFNIQKLKVKTGTIYSTFKRKKIFDEQENPMIARNIHSIIHKETKNETQ